MIADVTIILRIVINIIFFFAFILLRLTFFIIIIIVVVCINVVDVVVDLLFIIKHERYRNGST